jgi:ABC-type bacteriocin/lantibiotic exporter with double-glycine peptidase domain
MGPIPRIDQTDAREYESAGQARLWGGSTCSAASLTAVLRSLGSAATIADVMQAMPGGITVQQGLVSRPSLVNAAAKFGLQAQDNVTSYEALQQATAAGQPVLVDVTDGRFPEGHWMVVTAADQRGVSLVDSSGYKLASMSREEFQAAWSKRGIRIMNAPQGPNAGTVAGGR